MQHATSHYIPPLGLRPVLTILLCYLLAYFLLVIMTLIAADLSGEWPASTLLFQGSSAKVEVIYRELIRAASPWLMLAIVLLGLKSYLPNHSTRELLQLY
ncbi:MAG: hypothetical protein V4603_07740, partial [Pseudomonadota bacterium]